MKKICRNCGAKVPKKAEICPKCGEPYEYIDLVRLDPEEEKLIQVDKPSLMPNVCALLLAIAAFGYALTLVWMHLQNNTVTGEKETDTPSLSDEVSETFDIEHLVDDAVHEVPVVRDQDDREGRGAEIVLEPYHGL